MIFRKNENKRHTGMVEGMNNDNLTFDSCFECGNLDLGIKCKENEYDLFMRVDTNTRGHHQWFYFSCKNQNYQGRVKFNILNFTKRDALYNQVGIVRK